MKLTMTSWLACLVFFWLSALPSGAQVATLPRYRSPVTPGERARVLAEVRERPFLQGPAAVPVATPLQAVEQAIRTAQRGEPWFRRALDDDALRELQAQLQPMLGRQIPLGELKPIVDRAQMLLRESRGQVSLAEKVLQDGLVDRPNFHAEIAELRTARNWQARTGRELVLTKDPQSPVFDLTEPSENPRSYQLKVYAKPVKGLQALQADVANLPKRARYGLLPEEHVPELTARGYLRSRQLGDGPIVYRSTSGPEVTVLAADGIRNSADSVAYAQQGRVGLQELWAESISSRQLPKLAFAGEFAAGTLEVAGGGLALYASIQEWRQFANSLGNPASTGIRSLLLGTQAGTMTLTSTAMLTPAASRLFGWETAGKLAGRLALPLYAASELSAEGVAVYEYRTGRISRNQLIIHSVGPVTGLGSVAAGAAVGAAIGAWFGGGGALPGAIRAFRGPARRTAGELRNGRVVFEAERTTACRSGPVHRPAVRALAGRPRG